MYDKQKEDNMKKRYIRPTITKQVVGTMNKFGNSAVRNIKEEIGGASVTGMIEKHGSPLFVFDESQLRNQYRKLHQAFDTNYPNVQFSWSYKTNYLGAICSVLHQEGEIAEVVSGFEYQKARSLGMSADKIIFNGPWKDDNELRTAFDEGAMVHIDNFNELHRAEKIAEELGKVVPVGIRLNMDTGSYPRWSKFGFNMETTQAADAAARIGRSKWLELTGIHSHIGTFMLDPNAYAVQVRKMVNFMLHIEIETGCEIEYIDLGGGFPSKSKLKGTYLPPEVSVPDIEQYAESIGDALITSLPAGRYPKLYLETGRHVVDEAGALVTSVIAQKQLPDGNSGYFLDAGVNMLYTGTWYNYNIAPAVDTGGVPEACTLYGPLCMNIDVVAESAYLPPLPEKTPLVLWPVGAYNVTQWMQFITYRPAVIMVMEDGTTEVIRRKEVLEDVTGPEVIPEKLRSF